MKNLDAYKLKWIAIIGMFLNHAAMAFPEILPLWVQFVFYAAGGFTFPIMAFFVVEGCKYTSNLRKYLFRIFMFGIIAQVPYMIAFRLFGIGINIMFTIFLGIILLVLYDKIKIRILYWLIVAAVSVATFIFGFDWGLIGPIIMVMYRAIADEKRRRTIPAIVAGVFYIALVGFGLWGIHMYSAPGFEEQLAALEATGVSRELLLPAITFPIGSFITAYLLRHFSGERGKRMKYFFYIFYPLHFVVLVAIAAAFGLIDFGAIFGG